MIRLIVVITVFLSPSTAELGRLIRKENAVVINLKANTNSHV